MKTSSPLQIHFHVNEIHFHLKGFARRLVLKQRHKVIRKWPITVTLQENECHH